MSSGLRSLAMHLSKVYLGKALVRMSAMLIPEKQTTRASSPQSGRVSAMLRLVCRWCILMSPCCKWSCSHYVEDWSDAADKVVKLSLCCGESYRSLSVALPDNRSTVIKNQVSLMTSPCKSIICKTCITHSINPVLQFRICWHFVADVEVGCTH